MLSVELAKNFTKEKRIKLLQSVAKSTDFNQLRYKCEWQKNVRRFGEAGAADIGTI